MSSFLFKEKKTILMKEIYETFVILGLAEAGLIASKLSQRDMNISNEDENSLNFNPESYIFTTKYMK